MAPILKHLRSSTADKRPTASGLADGQLAINTASGTTALFFKDNAGNIVKTGPVYVGATAPNTTPAGSSGNSIGEQWLDNAGGSYKLKTWDGGAWRTDVISNADVASGAAIALSKLATGALPSGITIASANIVDGTIVNADINASAAIDLTKLASGALPSGITVASANIVNGTIVNADVASGAAIELGKLANGALPSGITIASANISDGTIVNADVASGAAIAGTKISPDFGEQNVVTSGTVQATSINNGPLAGFRNAIINGNFDIWQRGTSFTAAGYGADRWVNVAVGSSCTMSRPAEFAPGDNTFGSNPTYVCRMTVTSVTGSTNAVNLTQRIEGVRTFSGQKVTVSFWAKADASKFVSLEMAQSFGSGGSPSSEVSGIGTTKFSVGTTWARYIATFTVPSIAGKTIGTDGNSFLTLRIWFDAGSSFNALTNSLGHQSGVFDIGQVQVEPGPVATPFERRPIGTELALCQRYYQLIIAGLFSSASSNGQFWAVSVPFGREMRTTPTMALQANQYIQNTSAGPTADTIDKAGFRAIVTASGSNVGFQSVFTASAEL